MSVILLSQYFLYIMLRGLIGMDLHGLHDLHGLICAVMVGSSRLVVFFPWRRVTLHMEWGGGQAGF